MDNYYEVVAKCGHVGRDKYYRGEFYVKAETAKQAAQRVRYFARVKHDHPDAIISVKEICYADYLEGKEKEESQIYFKCHSKYMQAQYMDEISNFLYEEDVNRSKYLNAFCKEDRAVRIVNKKKVRNYKKYCMFRTMPVYDFAEA